MQASTDYRAPHLDTHRNFHPYVVIFKRDGKQSPCVWSCFATDARTALRTFELFHEGEAVEVISVGVSGK